ncbi:MAG TPA: hypothetical protein VK932_22445, partial [Kofleriaceae bacterium]|nr:hypothetical protein [Kofleriaceae bacterium]
MSTELESQRDRARIERDLKDNARIIESSRKALDFSPETPKELTEDVGHLHLSHPVTQRILSRLLAQGFSERDLTRVSAIFAEVAKPVALALARLSLFGP